ncbi:diphthine--ammonia ligase [Endozoicomonas sp. SM1973]|uniref:Diphthine--ammonia ligase n=1 Tax=Spartinivicinus marinus TaxID=2994442 RepID=A0A853I199_9GAMM|nr:diphthine--ammonia ligase [Spartinivicinus marinus]MCX4029130.1 diphthine--ammonia ligase [Spartinivicinus marinus]NYZ67750.1 diphthine--ammonia ligase [Spartinivicinus marinus]
MSKAIVSWSGGKDSCLALYQALRQGYEIVALLVMMNDKMPFSRSNGASKTVLVSQAKAIDIPIHFVYSSWTDYETSLLAGLKELKQQYQAEACIFGDIDIIEHRKFEEKVVKAAGMTAHLPLWEQTRAVVSNAIIASGIKAKISVVRTTVMPNSFLGEDYHLLPFNQLEAMNIDVCGENGEFHTIVYDAPFFSRPIELGVKERHTIGDVELCEFVVLKGAAKKGIGE